MDALRSALRPVNTPPVPTAPYPGRPAISPYGPHPTGGGVVGTYVQHSYEPSRQPYQQIPAMRPAQDGTSSQSATPIYDALYSEYLRSFRTLPGDRSGEEDLGFKAFGIAAHSSRSGSTGSHSGVSGYGLGYQAQYPGYAGGRPYSGHVPAALPPAPRRGL